MAATEEAACMAALVASCHDPELRELYKRLIKVGKAHKVAIIAVMRKMVVMNDALMRDRRTWTPVAPVRAVRG